MRSWRRQRVGEGGLGRAGWLFCVGWWALKTDHWFYGLFQSAPDLIALLLPQGASAVPKLGPDSPGDALYRFEAPELKAASHRLDGAFWPRSGEAGTLEQPVVLLEVQMRSKPGFKHRLGTQSFRFLQIQPRVHRLAVVLVVPQRRDGARAHGLTRGRRRDPPLRGVKETGGAVSTSTRIN